MTSLANEPWFHQKSTQRLIDRLAKDDDLVLILGAGVGFDSGLPNWSELLRDVLSELGGRWLGGRLDTAQLRTLAEEILRREDLLAAGTIAETLAASITGFAGVVKQCLYKEHSDAREWPIGLLAHRAAFLALTVGMSSVITTNFDNLFDLSLEEQVKRGGFDRVVRSIARPGLKTRANDISVYHVHGFLPFRGSEKSSTTGRIVLGERDFYEKPDLVAWRTSVYEEAYQARTCLFVGSSVTDPNMTRYLYEKSPQRKHYLLAVRDRTIGGPSIDSAVAEAADAAQIRRLDDLGLTLIRPDYYGQVHQFLNEIALWKHTLSGASAKDRAGLSYEKWPDNYDERLKRWYGEFSRMALADNPIFRRLLLLVNGVLGDKLKPLVEIARGDGSQELLVVHVWARQPERGVDGKRCLIEWATSSGIWTHPRLLRRAPIETQPVWRAAETFCDGKGGTFSEEASYARGRWRKMWTLPTYLSGRWLGLPVGVTTLSSDAEESTFSDPRYERHVWKCLEEVGQELLNPDRLERLYERACEEQPA